MSEDAYPVLPLLLPAERNGTDNQLRAAARTQQLNGASEEAPQAQSQNSAEAWFVPTAISVL